MADDASKGVCFGGDKFAQGILNHGSADGGKSVAIVETKWRKLVTVAADFNGLLQGKFLET